jgi:hypothetical protein
MVIAVATVCVSSELADLAATFMSPVVAVTAAPAIVADTVSVTVASAYESPTDAPIKPIAAAPVPTVFVMLWSSSAETLTLGAFTLPEAISAVTLLASEALALA